MQDKFLLVSDLDDTLLGDDDALQRFNEFYQQQSDRLSLVYASGRFYESIQGDVLNSPLPAPEMVIGGVGSEMRSFPDGQFCQAWAQRMSQHWSAAEVCRLLAGQNDLTLQPDDCQSEFKVSYYLPSATSQRLDELQSVLRGGGIHASIIYSSHRDLDFLPAGVDKGTAAAFVAEQLGFDPLHVFVAGNSGNDSKLLAHNFHGIVVANAHEELKQLAVRDNVYLAEKSYADGVQEGIMHWIHCIVDQAG